MKVRSLIGGNAGKIIEMEFATAQVCVANGTAEWIDTPPRDRVRGMSVRQTGETEAMEAPPAAEAKAPAATPKAAPKAVTEPVAKPAAAKEAEPETSGPAIPANWRAAHHMTRRGWAMQIDQDLESAGLTVAEADAIIEQYLADAAKA